MKRPTVMLIVLGATLLVQAGFGLRFVGIQERLLASAPAIRIRVEPLDPLDPFRGRYVALSAAGFRGEDLDEQERMLIPASGSFYALLEKDQDGFYRIGGVALERPSRFDTWLELETDGQGGIVQPFDRYYMNEDAAPKAEEAYRRAIEQGKQSWILVKLSDGQGTIAGFVIGGVPAEEAAKALE